MEDESSPGEKIPMHRNGNQLDKVYGPMSTYHNTGSTCEKCVKTFTRKDNCQRHSKLCKYRADHSTRVVHDEKQNEIPMDIEDSIHEPKVSKKKGGADCQDAIAETLRTVEYTPTADNEQKPLQFLQGNRANLAQRL